MESPSQYWHPVCPFIAANHRMWVDAISSSSLEIREHCADPEIKLEVQLWLICDWLKCSDLITGRSRTLIRDWYRSRSTERHRPSHGDDSSLEPIQPGPALREGKGDNAGLVLAWEACWVFVLQIMKQNELVPPCSSHHLEPTLESSRSQMTFSKSNPWGNFNLSLMI